MTESNSLCSHPSSSQVSSSLLSRRRGGITPPTAGTKISGSHNYFTSNGQASALDYINQMFPTEASLSGVEPLMQKICSRIRRVDAGILAAVRQQFNFHGIISSCFEPHLIVYVELERRC